MIKLEQIQLSIEQLSASEIAKLCEWLDERTERDAKSGQLDKLAAQARANLKARRGKDS
jgi:hypothetical protein